MKLSIASPLASLWLASAVCLGLIAPAAVAHTLRGKVVAVADGDTITILSKRKPVKVRLSGIDAPEKRQAFGQRAKQGLSDCAFGRQADVQWKKADRYGRVIGKVTAEGVDCGKRQIQKGLAWHYTAYAKEQALADRATYQVAERQARSRSVGLWSERHPTAPWDFRKTRPIGRQPS